MKLKRLLLAAAITLIGATGAARADITVGVTVSATGPPPARHPEKNTVDLMPKTIAGQKINYIVLDDGSDTTKAVANTRKLITEDKVDVVLGSTITPNSLAMIDVVAENQVPMISMAASARIVEPVDAKRRWVFKTPQNDIMMSLAIATHMANNGVKTVGFIGFADAYGEGWYGEFAKVAALKGLQIVANERYARTDTAVTGQVLKIVAAKPDAVLVAGSGTPAALPQKTLKERGYTGKYYQTHGVANADFLRVGGKGRGRHLPARRPRAGGRAAARQQPGAQVGPGLRGGLRGGGARQGLGVDLRRARLGRRPADDGRPAAALKKAKPGTAEFRVALRDAIEQVKDLPGAHGIFSMSPTDHLGLDQRAYVMVKIVNGAWKYQP